MHSSVDRHLDCSCVLAIINSAAVNIGVHVSFQIIIFSIYMPSSGNSESYGNSVFRFFFKETAYKFSIVTVPT